MKVRKQIDEQNWDEATSFSDSLGRTIKTQAKDSQGDVFTETKYDNLGRVEKTSNPYRSGESNRLWTTPTYDELNRTKFVTTPDGAKVETQYSLATTGNQIGTVVTVIDQANKKRRSITNALGLLTRVDEPNDAGVLGDIATPTQPTLYEYDPLNNLKKVTQGEQVRTFTYDYLSRLKTATNPESGTVNYTYDLIGNLKTKTDARQITTTYDYDKASRIITRSYSDTTPQVNYFYDGKGLSQTQTPNYAKGKLTKISSSISETKYSSFDNFGRVLSHQQITDGNTYDTAYTYNLSGALIEETYPSGRKVRNTLDVDGKLAQVQSSKTNETLKMYANSFNYNASGAVESMRLGNGRFENTQFNSRLQPTQIGLGSNAASQNLLKLNFEYGATDAENNGNVTKQTITVPTVGNITGFTATQNYTYDAVNRLKSAVETIPSQLGWKQNFKYDRYGNRTFDTENNNTTTLANGCPVAICNPSANPTNNKLIGTNYDSVGNTSQDANGQTFVYDAENKQVQVSNASGIIGKYWYNGDGQRVKKYVPSTGETTVFVYDAAGKTIAEYSTIQADTPKINYTTTDHLGSPRINTDAVGKVIARHDTMPFGEEITRTNYGSDNLRNRFTSYERDGETGLDYAKARMFGSGVGRFTSPDNFLNDTHVSDPQSWNLYVYARNNPLNVIDPTGEKGKVTSVYDEKTNTTTIKITASFTLYGAKGQKISIKTLKDQAAKLKASIERQYKKEFIGDGKENGVEGRTYVLSADISVDAKSTEQAAIKTGADNIVEVGNQELETHRDGSDSWEGGTGGVTYRNEGENFDRISITIQNKGEPCVTAICGHEFGHSIGANEHSKLRKDLMYGGGLSADPNHRTANNELTGRDFFGKIFTDSKIINSTASETEIRRSQSVYKSSKDVRRWVKAQKGQ